MIDIINIDDKTCQIWNDSANPFLIPTYDKK